MEFNDRASLKDHYHSDYHRYNLKRKVAGLPLLTLEQFNKRQAQEAAKPSGMTAKQSKKMSRKESRNMKKEEKLSSKAEKVEVKTVKQQARQARIEAGESPEAMDEDESIRDEDAEWLDDEDEDDEVEIIHGESLFDDEILEDWPQILEYMEAKFGFIIPHIEQVADMEMLCQYLQIKINHCCRCLYSSKRFRSPEAVKAYMAAKGNRRFNSETFEQEFGRFYHQLAENKTEEEHRLALLEDGAWGEREEGVTASGKTLVPRDLAWVVKQKQKPEPGHAGVIAAQAEADERAVKGYARLLAFRKTKKSEFSRQDVHRKSKNIMNMQVKNNKLNVIPFECMLFGR